MMDDHMHALAKQLSCSSGLIIRHEPAIFFFLEQTNHQLLINCTFSQNKSAPANNHPLKEQAKWPQCTHLCIQFDPHACHPCCLYLSAVVAVFSSCITAAKKVVIITLQADGCLHLHVVRSCSSIDRTGFRIRNNQAQETFHTVHIHTGMW